MNWNRRDFVRAAAMGMLASLSPRTLPALGAARRAEFIPIRRNVGYFTERGGAIGWLINTDGVAVVDSQFADTAPLLLEGLRRRSNRPIDVLINSHHHGDHTGGNAVLRPNVRSIVAHTRSAENQRQALRQRPPDEAERALPDTTFGDTWSVQIGDETIRLKHYGPAHTGGDCAIFFERANVVHLGDLLNNRGYPNIDVPSGASLHGWIRVLEAIAPEYADDTIFIFGHAEAGYPFTGRREDLLYQRDYFNAVRQAAQRAIGEGRSREETIALQRLPGFEGFGGTLARLGLALGAAYDELTAPAAGR